MAKMKYNKKHNRYLGNEKVRSDSEYEYEKSQPTHKQKNFFKRLIMMCRENNVDCSTGRTQTRGEYAMAIDKLIKRLVEAGVGVKGNGKKAILVLNHKADARNNEYMTAERIVMEDDKHEKMPEVLGKNTKTDSKVKGRAESI